MLVSTWNMYRKTDCLNVKKSVCTCGANGRLAC